MPAAVVGTLGREGPSRRIRSLRNATARLTIWHKPCQPSAQGDRHSGCCARGEANAARPLTPARGVEGRASRSDAVLRHAGYLLCRQGAGRGQPWQFCGSGSSRAEALGTASRAGTLCNRTRRSLAFVASRRLANRQQNARAIGSARRAPPRSCAVARALRHCVVDGVLAFSREPVGLEFVPHPLIWRCRGAASERFRKRT
jgi:hypothetical protein